VGNIPDVLNLRRTGLYGFESEKQNSVAWRIWGYKILVVYEL
jgi:hypothetical protein